MPNDQHLLTEDQYNKLMDAAELEAVDTEAVVPGKTAPAVPSMIGGSTPAFFSGSLPPQFQLDSNFARARVTSTRVPHNDLMPLGFQSNPSTNAGANSTSRVLARTPGFTNMDLVTNGQTRVALAAASATPGSSGGHVAFNFRGVWLAVVPYFKGDEVIYQTSYWQAQAASTNSAPATGNANWQVVGSYAAFRGAWSSTTAYVAGDEVTYLGNFWVATTASTNSAPSFTNSNWVNAGPNNLDSVPDGTDFGRPPVSQYGPNSPIGKLTGFYLSSNPDFERNLTNYNIYDNNASGSITTSLIAISAAPSGIAPNGTNQVMKIAEAKVGVGPTPGLGGFSYGPLNVDTSNALAADTFHIGDTYIIDLLAWIPTGYTLNWASNSLGTGGSFQWLNGSLANTYGPSQPGASAWRHYIGRVIIGTSPSANAFPYFYLTGVDGVTWYVGSLHIVDINQTHRHGGIHTLVGSDGTKFGHAHSLNGAGVGSMIRLGAFRYNLNATGHGFEGIPSIGPGHFFGTQWRGTGTTPAFQADDTQASGTLAQYESGGVAAGVNSIYRSNIARYRMNATGHGFDGSPANEMDIFGSVVNQQSSGTNGTYNRWNDQRSGGRAFYTGAGAGTSAGGTWNTVDDTANTTRTILNSTPQWGFYGSPTQSVHVFAAATSGVHVTSNGAAFQVNDTTGGGRNYRFDSGDTSSAVCAIADITAGTGRTFLTSTPQWGFYGSPSTSGQGPINVETFGGGEEAIRNSTTSTGGGGFCANATGAGGLKWAFNSGVNTAGHYEITQPGTALRVQMNNTPQWGYYGAPGASVDAFTGGGVQFRNNGATDIRMTVNATGASQQAYSWSSGFSAAGVFNSIEENVSGRTYLTTDPRWGNFGTPSFELHTFGQVTMNQNGSALAQYVGRDTRTNGVDFNFQSGGSAAGVGNFGHNGNTRGYLNGTPQWGFLGSPSQPFHIFGAQSRISNNGSNPQWIGDDTGVGGITAQFGTDFPAVNRTFVYNSVHGTCILYDGSGNGDLFGSTPNSGFISAGAGNIADTSGNLVLKNKNDAAGTTSNPSTNGTGYSVMAEMTLTFTTKGNKVLLVFTGALGLFSSVDTTPSGFIAFFKDAAQLSPDYLIESTQTANGAIAYVSLGSVSFIDSPTAASHTYDVRWKTSSTNDNLKALNTGRRFQAVELG